MGEGNNKGGRPPLLTDEHVGVLRTITAEQPRSSLDEVTRELGRRTGMNVCTVTVRMALRQAGIERLKPIRKPTQRALVQGGRPLVDTLGMLLAVTVTAASVQDRDGAAEVVAKACTKVPELKKLYADAAYGGQCAQAIEKTHGIMGRGGASPRQPQHRHLAERAATSVA